jgi:hypothetical protein
MSDRERKTGAGAGTKAGSESSQRGETGPDNPATSARPTDDHESNRVTGATVSGTTAPSRATTPAPDPEEAAEGATQRGTEAPKRSHVGVSPAKSWEKE